MLKRHAVDLAKKDLLSCPSCGSENIKIKGFEASCLKCGNKEKLEEA